MKIPYIFVWGIIFQLWPQINHQELFLNANLLFHAGKHQDALKLYEALPESWAVAYNKGHCHYAAQEYPEAIRCWYKAYRAGGFSYVEVDILKHCSLAYEQLGITNKCIPEFSSFDKMLLKKSLFFWQLIFLLVFLIFCTLVTISSKRMMIGICFVFLITIGIILVRYYCIHQPNMAVIRNSIESMAGTSMHFNKVGLIERGMLATVLDQKTDWVLVSAEGIQGWIPASCIIYV